MSCKIIFGNNNAPTGVLDKEGNPSKLFKDIISNPHISGFDTALEVYLNTEQEGVLEYKTSTGDMYKTFKEALTNTTSSEIDAVVNGKSVFKINTSTDNSTMNGMLNTLVKEGVITGETYLTPQGVKVFKVSGESEIKKHIFSDVARTAIKRSIGVKAVTILPSGDFVINVEKFRSKETFTKSDGTVEVLSIEEVLSQPFLTTVKKYDEGLTLITSREFKNSVPTKGNLETDLEVVPENELQRKLLNFIKSLGIKTLSIADYVTKYSVKNGVEPSAQALADLTNMVIAFKDGVITTETLSEEVAHFIVASIEESKKEDMKRNIHKTKQWMEHANNYREIYSKTYQGEELDNVVREEILGKVLADAFISNFSTENSVSVTEGGIIQKLGELFSEIIDRIRAFFTSNHAKDLNNFTSQVYRNLINESLDIELANVNNTGYTLFSTSGVNTADLDKIEVKTLSLLDSLSSQSYELAKKYNQQGDKASLLKTKKSLEDSLDTITVQAGLVNLTKVALSQLNTLTKAVDNNNKTSKYVFSQEEHSVYSYFKNRTIPMANQILAKMSDKNSPISKYTSEGKLLFDQLQSTVNQFNLLEGRVPNANKQAIDRLIDMVVKKHELKGEQADMYREDMRKIMETAQKDTNWVHAHIGSLLHAKNGLLNLAGDVIERIQLQERREYLKNVKRLLNRLEKAGFPAEKLNTLLFKGKIINEKDPTLVEKVDREDKAEAFNNILGQKDLTEGNIEEFIAKLELPTATDQDRTVLKLGYEELYRIKSSRYVPYFNEIYKEELENSSVTLDGGVTYSRGSIQKPVIDLDAFYKSQAGQIRKNAEGGILSEEDNQQLRSLARLKQQEVNPREEDGKFKKGLTEVYDNTLGRFVVTKVSEDVFSKLSTAEQSEAEKIWGLNMLTLINTEFYKDKFGNNGEAILFFEKLDELQTEQEKWDFVKNNSTITFADEYWESFRDKQSLIDRLIEEGSEEAQILLEDIREHQSVVNSILKANREYNEPSEIDSSVDTGISTSEKRRIKEAMSILEVKYAEANTILKDSETQEEENAVVTTTNKAYKKDLLDSQDAELDFILGNVTATSKDRITKVKKIAEELKKGDSVKLTGLMERLFTKGMSKEELDNVVLEYAKSRLMPYYKRTEPEGYSQALEAMEAGVENNTSGAIDSFIKNPLVKISPNFIFFSTSVDSVNKDWLANKEAGREQYTESYLDRVRNEEYYNTFGISRLDPNLKPTKNLSMWEAREALLEMQDASIELLGLTGIQDRYLPPQMRKDTVRRFANNKDKKKALKDTVYDWIGVREDDLDYGQDINGQIAKKGSTLLTIPTYGVRKIEDQADVTDELLLSYSWFGQQASLHKARKDNIGDMFAIQDFITRDDGYVGKEAQATNTYKMFKSYLDANFYGVKDTFSYEKNVFGKKVDIGKMARVFNGWVRFSNLAGITVPITSLFQGKVQEFVERQVGEITNPIAYNLAHSYLKKHGSNAAKELMGLNSKAELNVYGEFVGMYNTSDRYTHSGYNKGVRTGLKSINGLHSLGNFPVTTTVMMSIIMDYRWVGGSIMSFDQYMRNNPNGSKEDWKTLDLFIEQMPVKDGLVTFNKEEIANRTGLSGEELEEWIELKSEAISNRVADAVQRVDSQIPEHQKSIAARHGIANFFLMHTAWFTLAIQTKIKEKHFNKATGMYQEGNWRTVGNLVHDMIIRRKDLKALWEETKGDPLKVKNLKRTAIEVAIGNALAIAALLLAKSVDDDDDVPFPVAYADYMLTRVANEQVSGTVGLPNQLMGIFSDPVIAVTKLKDLGDILDLGSSETISRGSYAGETKRMKFLYKNAPLMKDYRRLKDPTSARRTYQFFNLEQDKMFERYAWLTWFLDEEDE